MEYIPELARVISVKHNRRSLDTSYVEKMTPKGCTAVPGTKLYNIYIKHDVQVSYINNFMHPLSIDTKSGT